MKKSANLGSFILSSHKYIRILNKLKSKPYAWYLKNAELDMYGDSWSQLGESVAEWGILNYHGGYLITHTLNLKNAKQLEK